MSNRRLACRTASSACPLLSGTCTSSRHLPQFSWTVQSRSASGPGGNKIEPDEILRERAFSWLSGPGKELRDPSSSGPRYLNQSTNNPFPLNPFFFSEPVLSDRLRDMIYHDVASGDLTVRSASVKFNITMERVAAVVRLKKMEKDWENEGKQLATPYSDAVLAMLPQTTEISKNPHESITEIPVHPYTTKQIFHPAAESRQFTREDASRVFNENLLSSDKRIPHPQLIQEVLERDLSPREQKLRQAEREASEEIAYRDQVAAEKARFEQEVTVVKGERAVYRFRDARSDLTGPTGRDPRGLGHRYGTTSQARKKGVPKYPAKVEA